MKTLVTSILAHVARVVVGRLRALPTDTPRGDLVAALLEGFDTDPGEGLHQPQGTLTEPEQRFCHPLEESRHNGAQ